ncbi:M14 family zinc carboxypeptidase [Brucella anthropi]|uniref:M14 family zinc carboxypeptidase n=1 Tax=Brucella anthropi TaxID=529 RepID=UPI00384B7488
MSGNVVRFRPVAEGLVNLAFDNIYVTAADLDSRYRELENAFPDYVTSASLGMDAWGNDIREYSFTAPQITGDQSQYPAAALDHPKICLASGVHPFERPAIVATLLLFDDLCRRWQNDDMLTQLRWGARLVVVPCVNPSGVNAGHTRRNGNNVDLNRNFPFEWDLVSDATKGPSAGSEAETQIMMGLAARHPDAVAFIDHHSHDNPGYPVWYGARNRSIGLVNRLLREHTAWMNREILFPNNGNHSRVAVSPSRSGMLASQWQEVDNVTGFFLEGPMANQEQMIGISSLNQRAMNVRALLHTLHGCWRHGLGLL